MVRKSTPASTSTSTTPVPSVAHLRFSPCKSPELTKNKLRTLKAFEDDLDYIQAELDWLKARCESFYYYNRLNDQMTAPPRRHWRHREEEMSQTDLEIYYDQLVAAERKLREQLNLRLAAHRVKGTFTLALDALCDRCNLNDFHRTVMIITSATSFTNEFEVAFGRLMGEDHGHSPDVEMLFRFFELSFKERIDHRSEFSSQATLIQNDLVHLDIHRRYRASKDLLTANVEIDQRAFSYIIGRQGLNDEFLEFSSVDEPFADFTQVVLPDEDKRRILSVVENHEEYLKARSEWGFDDLIHYGKGAMMLFYGPPGTGKTMTAHAIAKHLKKRVFNVDIPTFVAHGEADRFLPGLFREARLQNAVLFFDECEILFMDRSGGNTLTTMLLTELERFEGVAVFATNLPHVLDEAFQRRVLVRVSFPEPDASSRAEIWRKLTPARAPMAADVDYDALGARFEITGGYIKNAMLAAVAASVHSGQESPLITMAQLEEAARQQMQRVEDDPNVKVPSVRLTDVVLEAEATAQIQRVVDAVRHLPSVLRRWKVGGVGGDRGGVVGLLHGLPGTGKTLCAEAIAGELNRPLMVARSSTILSKWVGESERNLDKLFKEAKAAGAVLFIDEADSLVGQRDKVQSEHSRSLINLLLALIERHSGLVLLATNFRDGLDSALERRVTHQVELERPSIAVRRRLWEKMLPQEATAAPLDLDSLSRFELSGAEIRVVILRAATRAAAAGDEGLTQAIVEGEAEALLGGQQKKVSIGFGRRGA